MPVAEVGDYRVHFEEHGSGDPVLLISGLGADHKAWALQTEYLKNFFRVVVFDNPGVGQTEGPRRPVHHGALRRRRAPASCAASASSAPT